MWGIPLVWTTGTGGGWGEVQLTLAAGGGGQLVLCRLHSPASLLLPDTPQDKQTQPNQLDGRKTKLRTQSVANQPDGEDNHPRAKLNSKTVVKCKMDNTRHSTRFTPHNTYTLTKAHLLE